MRHVSLTIALLVLAGCHKSAVTVTDGGSGRPNLSESQALEERQACMFDAGTRASQTLASSWPIGNQIPIDHLVLIMQENHSFDDYFSELVLDGGVDVPPADASNPDGDGGFVTRFHQSLYCVADTNHSWSGVHQEIDDGGMDGFVTQNEPDGERAMGYYDSTDMPYYYSLAENFAISDRHFCSVPGETAPNREYYAAATTRGSAGENPFPPTTDPEGRPYPSIYSLLDDAGVDWNFYTAGATPQLGSFLVTDPTTFQNDYVNFKSIQDFWADADAGTLPSVAFVDEAFSDPTGGNEHPAGDVQQGEKFISSIVNALMSSSEWKSSALFITWDEHGGYYNHVPPPPACPPDDFPPIIMNDAGVIGPAGYGAFNMYGIRVPLLVVSPYAKRGYVSHHVTDHTSLLRFIEARFNLPALTRRDANAEPPYDMFNFDDPDFSVPELAPYSIDPPDAHGC